MARSSALEEHDCRQFNQFLFQRGTQLFCAFDLLYLDQQYEAY